MNRLRILSLGGAIAIFPLLLSAIGVRQVDARPYPDQLGICYAFEEDEQTLVEPCVISSGYGAGAHYVVLSGSDGEDTVIYQVTYCPEANFDADGFCGYTVDDMDADFYHRDVFMNRTTEEDPENLPCFDQLETGNSVCYRLGEI